MGKHAARGGEKCTNSRKLLNSVRCKVGTVIYVINNNGDDNSTITTTAANSNAGAVLWTHATMKLTISLKIVGKKIKCRISIDWKSRLSCERCVRLVCARVRCQAMAISMALMKIKEEQAVIEHCI